MKSLRPKIDSLTTKLIQTYPDIKEQYNGYKNYLTERKEKLSLIYTNNHIALNGKLDNYVESRIDDLYTKV